MCGRENARDNELEEEDVMSPRSFSSCSSALLLVPSLAEGSGEPLETFVETVTGGGAGRLDVLWGLVSR